MSELDQNKNPGGSSKENDLVSAGSSNTCSTPDMPPQFPPESVFTAAQDRSACAKFAKLYRETDCQLCFLLDDIPPRDSVAGLEMSSFRRVALFEEILGIENVLLLTHRFQVHGPEYTIRHMEIGRFDSVKVLNLYDCLQDINRAEPPAPAPEPVFNPGWHTVAIPDRPDTRVVGKDGRCLAYIRRFPSGKGIDYINFLANDKIYRRDNYDVQGFLSRTEFIIPGTNFAHTLVYYRPDHTIALTECCRQGGKDNTVQIVTSVEVMDRTGRVVRRFPGADELAAWWLLDLLQDRSQPRLVIADEISNYQCAFREIKKRADDFKHVKVIGVCHNAHTLDATDPMHSKLGDNFRFLCEPQQQVDAVVTLTQWQKHDVQERYQADAKPMTIIPHSMPDLREVPDDLPPVLPPHSIILVGRLTASKGQALAIEVLEEILKAVPDATLHLYGAGAYGEELKKIISAKNLQNKVLLHGFVSDIGPVYKSASVLISCSRFEGFGLTMQEAMFYGCPVVAFACRYGPESIVIHGENGYLVPLGDVKGMAARCTALLTDTKLRSRFSKAAVKSCRRFAKKSVAARWARLLAPLLQSAADALKNIKNRSLT
ncbi:MAG: glycosyltransferase [Succinivibrio sp.]|nr:glycosyltransferase [Succinivibrio sp.]